MIKIVLYKIICFFLLLSSIIESLVKDYQEGDICPICGKGLLKVHYNIENFKYKGQNLKLRLRSYSCNYCHETFFDGHDIKAAQFVIKNFQKNIDKM